MELRHLRYIVAVVEEGSFTRAAKRLHTAQPSLSRQIQDLEREVGTPLLKRNSRMLELTPAGRAFIDEARLVLAQAERAVERARQVARLDTERLIVGFPPGVEMDLLVRVMAVMQGEMDSVQLAMHSQSSPELIAKLQQRQIDAAFVRPDKSCDGLSMIKVRSDRLMVALPCGHRLASAKVLEIGELCGESMISISAEHAPVLQRTISEYVRSNGIELGPRYEAESLPMAVSLVNSLGVISLLPEYAARLLPPTVVSVPLAGFAPGIDLVLAYHPANSSQSLQLFIRRFLPG